MKQRQKEIIQDLNALPDWFTQITYLMELSARIDPMPAEWKTEENREPNCQSRSWAKPVWENDRLRLYVDSDALISKGLLGILAYIFTGAAADEILQTPVSFLAETSLQANIETSQKNGILHIIQTVQQEAAQYRSLK